jgi:hypothetical protein
MLTVVNIFHILRALSGIVALALLSTFSLSAFAAIPQPIPADGNITAVGVYDITGYTGAQPVNVAVHGVALTGTNNDLAVVIAADIVLTLRNASITNAGSASPITVEAGAVFSSGLVLVGNNSAIATGSDIYTGFAGVNVPQGAALIIEGPGSLTATGGGAGAGIGGNAEQSSGAIRIEFASVVATGGVAAAGIGGGGGMRITNGRNITIINASVTATGGAGHDTGGDIGVGGGAGAGIGGGFGGEGSDITITDSSVIATGGAGASLSGGGAGIGGGASYYVAARDMTGTIIAAGTRGGAGSDIVIDGTSRVQAVGGDGGNHANAGAGAGVGGGGGTNGGGVATNIAIANNTLALGSAGGTGSFNGALCGDGGGDGANGAEFDLGGGTNASVGTVPVNLADHPDPTHAYYPILPPVTNPSNQTIAVGGNTSFSVDVLLLQIIPMREYQWQVSSNSGGTWTDITDGSIYSGATTDTLTLTGVTSGMNGRLFRCVVADVYWRDAPTSAASLTIIGAQSTGTASIPVLNPVTLALLALALGGLAFRQGRRSA